MKIAKQLVKDLFKVFGIRLSKYSTAPVSPLLYHEIQLVFDVGANVGQFAMEKREEGYKGRIVSFEPLPDAHARLLEVAAGHPEWQVHKRCAVGDAFGEVEINVAGNSGSSSILPMLQTHSTAAPESAYIGKEKTEVITLDSVFDAYRTSNETTFLKIDTQGFEWEVLSGASASLGNIRVIQLELSVVPLYGGQYLYQKFFPYLEGQGFALWSVIPGLFSPTTGQMLQFDAVFARKE